MKKEIRAENIPFLDSINYIDDKYIAEVLADVKLPKDADDGRLRRAWKQIAVLAACAVILGALFPVVTRLIGRSQINPGGNPGAQSGKTTPIEGEELSYPIPEGGLDFIEHVGEVPEEFKEIVENDTFGDLREIEGRLYYTDQKDGFHYIVFVDNRGRETAVKTTKASRFSKLFLDSEGNYLAEYTTGVNNASILVKFDSNGNILFNLYCNAPVGSSLEYMVEVDGGYVFVGEMSVKSSLVNLTVTDVVISKISYDGKLENHNVFGGNDYDTVKHVEKTSEGVSVYFYMRNRSERVTSTLQRFDFDHNAVLKAQTEIKESDIPDVNDPRFTVDGKPYYKIADFFKDYDWDSSLNANVIEYDDCMLIVYTRFTSNWRHSTHGMLSSLPPIYFYRERVYAAYTKDGELIWRTAFDTTNYEMLK